MVFTVLHMYLKSEVVINLGKHIVHKHSTFINIDLDFIKCLIIIQIVDPKDQLGI